jgi:hypothetical protein
MVVSSHRLDANRQKVSLTELNAIAVKDRRKQGGFNRSSQHFSKRGCDEEIQTGFGSPVSRSISATLYVGSECGLP